MQKMQKIMQPKKNLLRSFPSAVILHGLTLFHPSDHEREETKDSISL